jgi:hypothetical protein
MRGDFKIIPTYSRSGISIESCRPKNEEIIIETGLEGRSILFEYRKRKGCLLVLFPKVYF